MLKDFSLISYGLATVAFALLALLAGSRYLRRSVDRYLLLASIISSAWAASVVSQTLWGTPGFFVRYVLEIGRDTAWILLMLSILKAYARAGVITGQVLKRLNLAALGVVLALLVLAFGEQFFSFPAPTGKLKVLGQIALTLLGISLLEQIWRNATAFGRSGIKYLCIGMGTLLTFDFFMYADALLFGEISGAFWNARGLVNAIMVPLFAVNVVNTRKQPVDFQLSRSAVFHAGTLLFAGGYMLILSLAGYYVRAMGGEWGEALQVLLLTIAMAFLVAVLASRRFRARMMVFISQNFFDYKYDYREEWLKMTRQMADLSNDPPLPDRVVRILAELVESNAGAIWIKDEQDNYALKTTVNLAAPKFTTIDANAEITRFFREKEWIIDLQEYRADPIKHNLLEIPDAISSFPEGWLIIPLYLDNELYGMALIGTPYAKVELNWENFDLIRVVARQTCNLLAQADAQNRLSRAMQFEAVNKASAFMMHDLKTLIAQLSLLVRNAHRHRDNPAFVDDMITTTEHAVRKMSNLMDHIRKPAGEGQKTRKVELTGILRQLTEQYARGSPAPRITGTQGPAVINADEVQLRSILGHLIQNAQDATPADGEITLTLKTAKHNVALFIQDTGSGMTEDFIRTRLFKPFESTKGLTGMGIGAYQAREYVRQIGGTMDITSEPDLGSCFTLRFPLAEPAEAADNADEPVPVPGPPLPVTNAK
ncbi:XrtA/PEP-CTERM system histidine kinase PrsK [Marinobacter sp.]|uniref:XrtA/PEP-CTERM system histidine kinase PrsK n=1 Tax=Marinobacter sp. TaxID=50741 RepID=UPI0019AA2DAC|nr:XrtA/PEP-CTERM system histidine kinase PrsK [Marinobacter sp.]MBC7191017.1 PEP-CTERM system histidine kinase PrsK [Marinobacter sp.]